MARLPRIRSIARFEFLSTVRRPAYLSGLILLPLTFVGLCALAVHVASAPVRSGPGQIDVVDHSGLALGRVDAALRMQERLETALKDVSRGRIKVLFELPDDYMSSGRVICYRGETLLPSQLPAWQLRLLTDRLRARLAASVPEAALRDRLLNPVVLRDVVVHADSTGAIVAAPPPADRTARLIAGVMLGLGLITLLAISAGYFLQSVSTERENHVIDVIRFSVTPYELILGKLMGLSGACLAPTLVFVALLAAGAALELPVSIKQLVLLAVFMTLGYLFTAALMVSAGALIDISRETSLVAVFFAMWAGLPLLGFVSGKPGLLDALTYFPLTAPITMVLRICLGAVTTIQAVLSAVLLVAATWACLRMAAALMERASNKAGPRAGLLQAF